MFYIILAPSNKNVVALLGGIQSDAHSDSDKLAPEREVIEQGVQFLPWVSYFLSLYCIRRHYGALEGRNKQQTVTEYGAEQVYEWRRSFTCRPPLCSPDSPFHASRDPKYAPYPNAASVAGESLEDTLRRVAQCWQER